MGGRRLQTFRWWGWEDGFPQLPSQRDSLQPAVAKAHEGSEPDRPHIGSDPHLQLVAQQGQTSGQADAPRQPPVSPAQQGLAQQQTHTGGENRVAIVLGTGIEQLQAGGGEHEVTDRLAFAGQAAPYKPQQTQHPQTRPPAHQGLHRRGNRHTQHLQQTEHLGIRTRQAQFRRSLERFAKRPVLADHILPRLAQTGRHHKQNSPQRQPPAKGRVQHPGHQQERQHHRFERQPEPETGRRPVPPPAAERLGRQHRQPGDDQLGLPVAGG